MSISFEILGGPGRDNAVLMRVDSGQEIARLLFDCGEHCLSGVPFGEVQAIDQVFFSHLHMDHICGFDGLFRSVFQRTNKPNQLWGPPNTSNLLQHRFQSYLWNLHGTMPSVSWRVTDVHPQQLRTQRFELAEAFADAHAEGDHAYECTVLDTPIYSVQAITLEHHTPVIGYLVREKPRQNIDLRRVESLGLRPGPWMQQLKLSTDPTATVVIEGVPYLLATLRETLLLTTPGDSVAYLTDFLLDEMAMTRLTEFLQDCHTIICEGQYRHADLALAQRHCHLTTVQAAQLAHNVNAQRLVLFHLSSRYQRAEWLEMLSEARTWFPAAELPSEWHLQC